MAKLNIKNLDIDSDFTSQIVGKKFDFETIEADISIFKDKFKKYIDDNIYNKNNSVNLNQLNKAMSSLWFLIKYTEVYCRIDQDITPKENSKLLSTVANLEEFLEEVRTNKVLKDLIKSKFEQSPNDRTKAWAEYFTDQIQDGGDLKLFKRYTALIDSKTTDYHAYMQSIQENDKVYIYIRETDTESLLGLNESALNTGKYNAEKRKRKGYMFFLDESTVNYLLRSAQSEKLRKAVYEKITRGFEPRSTNVRILSSILRSKKKIAETLGAKTYIDLVSKKHTLNTEKKISNFIKEVQNETLPDFQKRIAEVKEEAGGIDLKPWDCLYFYDKVQQKYIHDENTHEYFEYNKTLSNILEKLSSEFNVKIEEQKGLGEARIFHVKDQEHDKHAYLIISKCNNFETNSYQMDLVKQDNLTHSFKGVSFIQLQNENTHGNKALLEFNDVAIIVHELGHFFHAFYGEGDFAYDKFKMEQDLIELPSQFLEQKCKDYEFMKSISSHYKTEELLPKETFEKALKTNFGDDNVNLYVDMVKLEKINNFFKNGKVSKAQRVQLFDEMLAHGLFHDISDDMYMAYPDYNFDYGPIGHIYNYSLRVAKQLHETKKTSLKNTFVNTFNKNVAFLAIGKDAITHAANFNHMKELDKEISVVSKRKMR